MTARYRALAELGLACAALVGCVVSWLQARSMVAVAPIADGQPVTVSVVYYPPLLLLSLVLGAAAGVLAVIGAARLRCASSPD
jgi:ABC-type antimicrobial peptide transport system permease subunit